MPFNDQVNKIGGNKLNFSPSGFGSWLKSSFDSWTGKTANDLVKKEFDYNKKLNELQMQREDNTYVRTMSDLKNAGLNPSLLLGGSAGALSASAGSPVSNSGTVGHNPIEIVSQLGALLRNVQDIKQSEATIKNLQASTEKLLEEKEGQDLKNQYQQVENDNQEIMNKVKLVKNYNEAKASGSTARANDMKAGLDAQEFNRRNSDGTYRNQPVVKSGWNLNTPFGGFGYESSEPYTGGDTKVKNERVREGTWRNATEESAQKSLLEQLGDPRQVGLEEWQNRINKIWQELRQDKINGEYVSRETAQRLRNYWRLHFSRWIQYD